MKLLTFIAVCVYFVQTCFAVPRTLSNAEIQNIQIGLELTPGMEPESIENIVNTLKKYRSNPVRLFTIAIQGDTCTKNSVDLKHISTVAVNNSERYNNATNDAAKDTEAMKIIFTDSELQVVETELSKYLEPEKVQRALTFYRGFQKHASQQELESSTIDLLMSAVKAVINGCPTENSSNNQL